VTASWPEQAMMDEFVTGLKAAFATLAQAGDESDEGVTLKLAGA
jgi:hypothetical protein